MYVKFVLNLNLKLIQGKGKAYILEMNLLNA